MNFFTGIILHLLLIINVSGDDKGPFTFEFEELADGVWAGVRPDGPRFPVMGNVTFVISEEGVVVFDGGGMPTMSEQVISKIKSLTDKPVTHVITSHWHGDHNFGVYRFAEEFDDVTFIAHEFTQQIFNSTRINYIDRERGYVEQNKEEFQKIVDTGLNSEGEKQSEIDRNIYRQILEDGPVIDRDFLRAKLTPADILISDSYTIESGSRTIQLLHLGQANTEGDIAMWLEEEKILASGDIVVAPSPHAFNVPPRIWAETLNNVQKLDYRILVPGHGPIQRDKQYVDLMLRTVTSIADQRDQMLSEGKSHEEIQKALDFTAFESQFTDGDAYLTIFYNAWFTNPLRAAAIKELSGEQMVVPPPPVAVPFNDPQWQINANEHELVTHLERDALKIKGGSAVLSELDLKNAMIEFDMAITPERGFAGLIFRQQDANNYEHFYIRPHQSGKPDANQYTPVFNSVSGWQLYHGNEYATPVNYPYHEWIAVKVIYAGNKALIYINSEEPVLRIDDLKRSDLSGAIGVNSANFSAVHFSNFRYTKLANAYAIPNKSNRRMASEKGMVTEWQISESFPESMLRSEDFDMNAFAKQRSWQAVTSEATGITNIARVAQKEGDKNTVLAKITFTSEEAKDVLLNFGYSDRAYVYVDGKNIYQGNNRYQSRDYRYLGTIGLFDAITVTAKKGRNEVIIAVAEDFGGWGVMANLVRE